MNHRPRSAKFSRVTINKNLRGLLYSFSWNIMGQINSEGKPKNRNTIIAIDMRLRVVHSLAFSVIMIAISFSYIRTNQLIPELQMNLIDEIQWQCCKPRYSSKRRESESGQWCKRLFQRQRVKRWSLGTRRGITTRGMIKRWSEDHRLDVGRLSSLIGHKDRNQWFRRPLHRKHVLKVMEHLINTYGSVSRGFVDSFEA